MRLDKFLQVSRIVKQRTVANAVCSGGKILVNGQRAKATRTTRSPKRLKISL